MDKKTTVLLGLLIVAIAYFAAMWYMTTKQLEVKSIELGLAQRKIGGYEHAAFEGKCPNENATSLQQIQSITTLQELKDCMSHINSLEGAWRAEAGQA